jgi:aminomethyltransferase
MYELDHIHEYLAIRTACGLYDISPLYKYHVHGPDALRLLNRVVTQDVRRYGVGRVMYTPWCDDEGYVIDDGTVAHLEENFFRLTAADPTLGWLEDNAVGLDVSVEDVTDALAGLALQGPMAREILNELADSHLNGLGYFRLTHIHLGEIPVTITRTGYTGDLGYEIWVDPAWAEALWDGLTEVGDAYRLRPFGHMALDMARIEAGLLLIDVDFHSSRRVMFDIQKSTPYELGLGWTVKLDQPFFVGHSALRREKARGSHWLTVGLEIDLKSLEAVYADYGMPLQLPYGSWNEAVPVYAKGRPSAQVGKATSGTWSPVLKKYIALARLRPAYAKTGNEIEIEVTVEAQRRLARARVVPTPFFDPPRKRA